MIREKNMKVINATLRKKTGLFTISYHNGVIDAIEPQTGYSSSKELT
jgi:hypothetical protein